MVRYILQQAFYHLTSLVPAGRAATYGSLARILSVSPRLVGQWLHQNPSPAKIPCHRVIFNNGSLSRSYIFGGAAAQRKQLAKEGVRFEREKVKAEHFFRFRPLIKEYLGLWRRFGPPGPWPWFGGERHRAEEIIIGAILTQRTSWKNVQLALNNLREKGLNNLNAICRLGGKGVSFLAEVIRPSGFHRQKAQRLFGLACFAANSGGLRGLAAKPTEQLREELLSLEGVGPETADTIMLYALGRPVFVIDEYTRRFVRARRLTTAKSYSALQQFFQTRLLVDLGLYQNFHALIVRWGKKRTGKHPHALWNYSRELEN